MHTDRGLDRSVYFSSKAPPMRASLSLFPTGAKRERGREKDRRRKVSERKERTADEAKIDRKGQKDKENVRKREAEESEKNRMRGHMETSRYKETETEGQRKIDKMGKTESSGDKEKYNQIESQ